MFYVTCADILCYRCVTEVPWLPTRSHWHCHVLMFGVTDVLLKCHSSVPGHTDIGMSWCFVTDVLMFFVTAVLLKCHGSLPGHTDIVMSWCSVLQMHYWSAMAPVRSHWHCHVLMFYVTCADILCYRCVTEVPSLPCQVALTLSCPDVLCYRCVTEVPWFPARSHWHCHVLMFCVTDVLLKCHSSLPGHTDIVMSWCSVLQMCYWSAMAPCQVTLTLSCPDVLCYRCVTEVPWLPARSHWHCHVLCLLSFGWHSCLRVCVVLPLWNICHVFLLLLHL